MKKIQEKMLKKRHMVIVVPMILKWIKGFMIYAEKDI
jgi:hypothetical protein